MKITVRADEIRKGDQLSDRWYVYHVAQRPAYLVEILLFRKRARSTVWKELEFREMDRIEVNR